jgi:hypothetical protein
MMASRAGSLVVSLCVIVVVGGGSLACAPVGSSLRRAHPLLGTEAGREAPSSSDVVRPVFDDPLPADGPAERDVRARIAAAAASSLGDGPLVVGGVRYRLDCSGVAAGIYAKAGLVIDADQAPSTRALFEVVRQRGSFRRSRPLQGDLVFFDDTYDANDNGRRDDPLSHVGVVERIEDDGVVVFVHRVGEGIVRGRLHLGRPHDRVDERGRTLNHALRKAEGAWPSMTTGALFAGFGSLPTQGLSTTTADPRRVAGRSGPDDRRRSAR